MQPTDDSDQSNFEPGYLAHGYFDDDYTLAGYCAPHSPARDGLRFSFRPALVEERCRLIDVARRQSAVAYDRQAAELTAARIVAWDLLDAHGAEVPVTPVALLNLPPELFARLHAIVVGAIASDVDPRWTPDQRARVSELELAAAASGRTVGDVREEQDRKN